MRDSVNWRTSGVERRERLSKSGLGRSSKLGIKLPLDQPLPFYNAEHNPEPLLTETACPILRSLNLAISSNWACKRGWTSGVFAGPLAADPLPLYGYVIPLPHLDHNMLKLGVRRLR